MSEDLPPGWATLPLGKLGRWRGGGTPSKRVREYWENGTVHWVSPKDMKRLLIDSAQDQITDRAVTESATTLVPESSVLMVTRSGILAHSFPVAVNTVAVTLNQDMKAVTPYHGINATYTAYYLKARSQDILDECSKDGTTVSSIDTDALAAYQVALAPTPEQERIVSKIDELFSRIDEGERALEGVAKLVERYRQSVLKAAVTGELTRDLREARNAAGQPIESGEALLTRILTARREAWERAELVTMQAKGITPKDDAWKKKYKQPTPPDASGLSELPEGWVWASVQQLCFVDTGATPKRGTEKYFNGGTIDWITSGAVNEPVIHSAAERITPAAIQETNAKVFPAGSLIVAMYGEGKTRGKVSELGIAAATNQACAALICSHLDVVVKTYIRTFFEKNYEALRMEAAGGVQPNLNLAIIKETVIPLPPLGEVREINEVVATRLSQVAAIAAEFQSWRKRSSALRQRILSCAFTGTLVGQDVNDEAASILLERIAAERAVTNAVALKRSRKKKST